MTRFLERYLARARHIEVQVLGDTHGNHLHLWDRDCSLQRNHQKLIEEAPAPNLPDAPRQVMLDAAVGLARAINYRSAGTVEYLYDPADHAVYFLEMNTRIQVEHPVTEAITGIDLIDWQLRIAQGAALSMTQDQIPCTGHAIEVRVSAENPAEGFLPQTGTLSLWQPPKGPGLRLDSGVGQGSEVSHHYDSMIAKLIAHAPDRQSAIQRAVKGIDDFATGGVGLNLTYQRALLCHPDFGAVTHFTSGLDAMFPGGWAAPVADPTTRALAVLALHLYLSQTGQGAGPWRSLGAWRLTDKGSASYWHDAGGKVFVAGQGPDFAITDGDADAIVIQTASLHGPHLSVTLNDAPVQRLVHFERRGGQWCVYVNGQGGAFEVLIGSLEDRHLLQGARDGGASDDMLCAPMPGAVAEILVTQGQHVNRGDTLVVLEAMKLLQSLAAPATGTIAEIFCEPGDNVAGGAPLIRIDPKDET